MTRRERAEQVHRAATVRLPPLEDLYRSHGPAVLRRARQLLGSDDEARDVLQDVFASLLRRPEQFEGRSSPMTFLYAMTTHCALGRLRLRRSRDRLLQAHVDAHSGITGPLAAAPDTLVLLRDWLAALPEELATVAVYYHLDEMTQDEIAVVMACSRQWVGKLLRRLREPAHGGSEP